MAILSKFRSLSSRTAIPPADVFNNIIHHASSLVLLAVVAVAVVVILPPPVAASPTFGGGDVGGNSSSSSSSAAFVARPPRGGSTAPTTPMKLLQTSATFMKRSSTPPSPRQMRMRSSFSSPGAGDGDGDGDGEGGTTTTTKTTTPSPSSAMRDFYRSLSSSWIDHLSPESPENYERSVARVGSGGAHPGRPVFNGHYVEVRPTPLKNPTLVIHSPETMIELGCFGPGAENTEDFARYFAGDVDVAAVDVDVVDASVRTWATPYALSIMGRRYTNNCPYGTGDGYGDGRAISVGEIPVGGEGGRRRLELQLKGAGRTPFCRGADGRAVLRSSIREFLGSEAMHHLGVSTTRALCLVTSDGPDGDTSRRPWYSGGGGRNDNNSIPNVDDPRLARFDMAKRREIISQLRASTRSDPDVIVEERCAITTRVAPSFVRIGHLDLFARRVDSLMERMTDDDDDDDDVDNDSGRKETAFGLPSMPNEGSRGDRKKRKIARTTQYRELEDMMWHACYREYHDEAYAPHAGGGDAMSAALALMEGAMVRIANMVGGWIRVGFVQGNFNADNCLVGGRTMDYGPFGFLDVYHPLAAKWTGSGDHFGFMNQPSAGYANFAVLVESLLPIIDVNGGDVNEVRDDVLKRGQAVFSDAVNEAFRSKMGLVGGLPDAMTRDADELWEEIEPLLRIARGDWTLFWRQLTYVAARYSPAASARKEHDCSDDSPDYDGMMTMLLGEGDTNPFYDALDDNNRDTLRKWIVKWHVAMTACYQYAAGQSKDVTPPEEIMRLANPKYTLREWMLVEAYTKADPGKLLGNPFSVSGDYSGVHELFRLCKDPYGEGTADDHQKYYRRAPDESLRAGGTAFMS